ncbi:MAG: GAF and ANTAR domain-containing protein [Frankiales bacterium]|nr:GAF and ANTAR domain-containing protein [Frankiales bacterium]
MTVSEDAFEALTQLAGIVLVADDLANTYTEMCRIAVRAVPPAVGASVTTHPEGRPAAVASDGWAQDLDELQFEEHEGPCLDAYRTGNAFRVRDFQTETRWPFYSQQAVRKGAISMVSVPLTAQGNVVGALNLYARSADAFDAEATALAHVVAGQVGLASQVSAAFFRHRDLAEQLADAMSSRAMIEQAKGVIMADRRCDADAAFAILREMSQRNHRKLREVARDVVENVSRGS